MNEISVVFGAEHHLVGTLTLPAGTPAPVAFVLLNAGVVHRMGPHRINVKLARHLASLGYATLRFDLGGQGDSRAPSTAGTFKDQAISDLRAAMDHLGRTADVHRFAIAGICSGADNGWNTAQVDERVVGLCQIDGPAYPTPRTREMRIRTRLAGPLVGELLPWAKRKLAAMSSSAASADLQGDDGRQLPTREEYIRTMQSLVDRGVNVCAVFTGSMQSQYSYAEQYREAFAGHGFADKVRAEFQPTIDHTVTPVAAQQRLVALIGDWAASMRA